MSDIAELRLLSARHWRRPTPKHQRVQQRRHAEGEHSPLQGNRAIDEFVDGHSTIHDAATLYRHQHAHALLPPGATAGGSSSAGSASSRTLSMPRGADSAPARRGVNSVLRSDDGCLMMWLGALADTVTYSRVVALSGPPDDIL